MSDSPFEPTPEQIAAFGENLARAALRLAQEDWERRQAGIRPTPETVEITFRYRMPEFFEEMGEIEGLVAAQHMLPVVLERGYAPPLEVTVQVDGRVVHQRTLED